MGHNLLVALAAPLDMPFQRDHVPWAERTRREKIVIILFYGVMLALVVNIVGWIAFICVFMHPGIHAPQRTKEPTSNNKQVTISALSQAISPNT
ncbi:uncharacterized protein Dvir_GJ24188, isoform A [Drosophila virilis]|uniref:Uncharacterized protein, isoform A n=1 Tax=Drosophila virilis TaxID=7244 RepID=B4M198_DROVI|nr:uncharacterized protein Dvir_GJ24188, isoform A [Drosophila virilis]